VSTSLDDLNRPTFFEQAFTVVIAPDGSVKFRSPFRTRNLKKVVRGLWCCPLHRTKNVSPDGVAGSGQSVKEWSAQEGWNGRTLNQHGAKGILVGALGVLAVHYGYAR
jgi:hypothetical protein